MLDKLEPPQIQEGYGLSVAVLTLLNVVRCVHKVIDGSVKDDDVIVRDNEANDVDAGYYECPSLLFIIMCIVSSGKHLRL